MTRKKSKSELFPPKPPPENPVIIRERRRLEEKAKAQRRERSKHKRNPKEKMRARAMVKNAIKRGDLKPSECEYRYRGCQSWPVEGHHTEGYSAGRELVIRWVCKSCHDKITVAQRKMGGEVVSRKVSNSFPVQVIHIIGPPLSGKSYALRHAGVDDGAIWSVMDFCHRIGAIKPREPFPPRLRLLRPQEYRAKMARLTDDLHQFLTSIDSEILYIESSGNSKKLKKYLDSHADDFKVQVIKMAAPSLQALVHRCKLKGFDIISIKDQVETWRWGHFEHYGDKLREYTQSEAIEAIRSTIL